jgi:predicted Zn finger-like uncharacterized protein
MIIECPACDSRYRIREDKLPGEGGNIKCPNCAHVFFVARPAATGSHVAAPSSLETQRGAPAPESAGLEAVSANSESATQQWKLRNNVGLVYDFPSVDQLRSWLTGRDSFDGFTVSKDRGKTWHPISDSNELEGVQATGRKATAPLNTNRSTSVQVPRSATTGSVSVSSADDMRREAQARVTASRARTSAQQEDEPEDKRFELIKPPANSQAERTSKILLVLSILILPVLAFVALRIGGVEMSFMDDVGANPAAVVVAPVEEPEPEQRRAEVSLSPDERRSLLLSQASAALSREDFGVAIERLEAAVAIAGEARALQCELAPLYTRVQRTDDAAAAQSACDGADAAEAENEAAVEEAAQEGSAAPPE